MKVKPYLILLLVVALGVGIVGWSYQYLHAMEQIADGLPAAATELGAAQGHIVGTAVGSFNGITQGLAADYQDGKEEGLQADDATAVIKGHICEIGRLEVVRMDAKAYTVERVGDKYVRLKESCFEVIYSVDLTAITVEDQGDHLLVTLPPLEADVSPDTQWTTIAEEELAKVFNGSTADGISAQINHWKSEQNKRNERFNDPKSEEYQNAANIAKQHVEELVKGFRFDDEARDIVVEFQNGLQKKGATS